MKIQAHSFAKGAGLLVFGIALGFVGSQRYWFHWSSGMLEQAAIGRANLDILALSNWRTGSEDEARAALEGAVDTAVGTIYTSRKASGTPLPKSAVKLFQLAKVYRTAFPPPENSQPSLLAALNSVPMPSPRYCSPALQKIMANIAKESTVDGQLNLRDAAPNSAAPADQKAPLPGR